MTMNIKLTRTLATFTIFFVTITSGTNLPAEEVRPAVRNVLHCAPLGLTYTIRTSNWGNHIFVEETKAGFACEIAGIEPGDWIWRINNQRVRSTAQLQFEIARSPNLAQFYVWDKRRHQWRFLQVQVSPIGQPLPPPPPLPPPAPPVPGGPDLSGSWRSSLSGTMEFTLKPWGFSGNSIVPFVGSSKMGCTRNNNGSYNFSYKNYSGVVDSGHGTLSFVGWNKIKGSVTSSSGIRAEFILTRQ